MKNTIILSLIYLLLLPSLEAREKALISIYDSVAVEGGEIEIKAKIEKDKLIPFRTDLENMTLRFSLNQKEVGLVRSGKDGYGRLTLTHPLEVGTYEIEVELVASRLYQADKAQAHLSVWSQDQKLIVTDIDQTISAATKTEILRLPIAAQKTFPFSADYLNELADQDIGIIYLTAREDVLMESTRAWLNYHRFPQGHLVLWDLELSRVRVPWNHGAYKSKVLASLTKKFPGQILAGFGDRPHDIQAYIDNQIPAYLLRSHFNQDDSFPSQRTDFRSWSELTDLIQID